MPTEEEVAVVALVREKIGEMIPEEGTEADTLFTDAQISVWIAASSSVNSAIASGWESKMAHWAGLVNVTDGAAARAFSDLFEHARLMSVYWGKKANPMAGRSRVGKIIRDA